MTGLIIKIVIIIIYVSLFMCEMQVKVFQYEVKICN